MSLNKSKGRMFKSVGWTWNPISGCIHNCKYCWAKKLFDRWGRTFEPKLNEKIMNAKFPEDGTWIFVGSTGDAFCYGVEDCWIEKIFKRIIDSQNHWFLLQTKNTEGLFRSLYFNNNIELLNGKIVIGTTLETNRDTPWSKAPPPIDRWFWMMTLRDYLDDLTPTFQYNRFLSLEPLADFDLETMKYMIKNYDPLPPGAIEIGLENYSNFTTPPSEEKIKKLLQWLSSQGYTVILKENLDHLYDCLDGTKTKEANK